MSEKEESSKSAASGGIGTIGLLGVLFVGLKLTHQIDWSWWWVTLPFWGAIGLVLSILVLAVTGAGVILLVDKVTALFARRSIKRMGGQ
jgi:hypothetical protein